METFLEKVVRFTQSRYSGQEHRMVFVGAGNRVMLFLRKYYAENLKKTTIAPEFITIETLAARISKRKELPRIHLLFELYETYCSLEKSNSDDFETFLSWGQTLLQDFNEIDQYLIDPDKIFPYVKAIKEVEHWSGADHLTDLQKKHLAFWNKLGDYYKAFREKLSQKDGVYNGMIYREVVEKMEAYAAENKDKIFLFVGLNALTRSQEKMVQFILENTDSEVFWDTDEAFFQEETHDAALFINSYIKEWTYFKIHRPQWISQDFDQPKQISIVGVSKRMNQAHKVAELVRNFSDDDYDTTAVVLPDEGLLLPVINALDIDKPLNITMGYPLQQLPLSDVFTSFFKLYFFSWRYYKDVLNLLTLPYVAWFFDKRTLACLKSEIRNRNWVYVKRSKLMEILPEITPQEKEILDLLLIENEQVSADDMIENAIQYLLKVKEKIFSQKQTQMLLLEQTYRFYTLFQQLRELQRTYGYIHTPKTLYTLYLSLLQRETLDFKGEPLQGLQLMGIMESRNIDFKQVIITSVNEGILPKGSLSASFIPYEVRCHLGLPTYQQKDAMYAYYFYRLLQRAEKIHILYNTDSDMLGAGEKSRFVAQLENFAKENHLVTHSIEMPQVKSVDNKPVSVYKDEELYERLQKMGENGFSPSALANYIRDPLLFYRLNVLGIQTEQEVEESIDVRTFGTIIHAVLEDLYRPFLNEILTVSHFQLMKQRVSLLVETHFHKKFEEETTQSGKNFLVKEVIEEYIYRFLQLELKEVESGKEIIVLQLETQWKIPLKLKNVKEEVFLKGIVDRIDKRDGVIHIIDYKTGRVSSSELGLSDWEKMIEDAKYTKAFQLLTYAYMYAEKNSFSGGIQVGNYSFKNLSGGFLKFSSKDKTRYECEGVDTQVLQLYENELERLLQRIFDRDIPFEAKER